VSYGTFGQPILKLTYGNCYISCTYLKWALLLGVAEQLAICGVLEAFLLKYEMRED